MWRPETNDVSLICQHRILRDFQSGRGLKEKTEKSEIEKGEAFWALNFGSDETHGGFPIRLQDGATCFAFSCTPARYLHANPMSDMTFKCILFDKSAINLVDFERSIAGGQSYLD